MEVAKELVAELRLKHHHNCGLEKIVNFGGLDEPFPGDSTEAFQVHRGFGRLIAVCQDNAREI